MKYQKGSRKPKTCAEAHQSVRFYRTGPLGSRHEADRGQGTVRSGDSRQENREPGKVYEKSPASLQTGGTIKHLDHTPVERGLAQFFKKATAKAPGIAKNDDFFATALSTLFTQAENNGGICAPGG